VTRTRPLHLVLLVLLGAAALWFVQIALAAAGRPVVIPPYTLGVALLLIGVIVVAMAWPVWRVTRKLPGARVDPFYATRVVMLAKASSLGGALLAGSGVGLILYFVSRSVLQVGSITMAAVAAGGAVLLLVAGLVAEHMCTIPPDDDEQRGTPETQGLA
jgi:hypothetical protein